MTKPITQEEYYEGWICTQCGKTNPYEIEKCPCEWE